MRVAVFAALLVAAPLAHAQVVVTDVHHRLAVFADALLDPDESDIFTGSAFGHFDQQNSINAGYPTILSEAVAAEDSTVLVDASMFRGVVSASADGWTYEWDQGMASGTSSLTVSFTIYKEVDIAIEYAIDMARQGTFVSNYAEVGLLNMSTFNYLYIADHGFSSNGLATTETITLAPGDYQLNLLADALAGTLFNPDIAGYTSNTTLTFDVSFVPAPATIAGPLAAFFLTKRRRRST